MQEYEKYINDIEKYIKLGEEVEANEDCPECSHSVIQHLDNKFLCPGCGANLEYDFENKKWK